MVAIMYMTNNPNDPNFDIDAIAMTNANNDSYTNTSTNTNATKWNPSSKFCASSAHIGWTGFAIVGFSYHGYNIYLLTATFLVYAFLKEYWADAKTILPFSGWLENDSIKGSTLDFVTYIVGVSIGIIAIHSDIIALVVAIFSLILLAVLDYVGAFSGIE